MNKLFTFASRCCTVAFGAAALAFLLPTAGFAQASDQTQRVPATRDGLREQYTQRDYEEFVKRELRGEIPRQGGPVFSPTAADARVNNNGGAGTTANFTQSETSILAFGTHVVIGFNDAGSNAGGANKFTGWAYSADGGATFTDGGTLPTNPIGDAGDPVLARNEATGRIYFSTLGFNSPGTIQVFRSDDNGVTWMAPVNGSPGGSSEDKQWIAVDNFPGSGNGNVYLLSRRFGAGPGIYMFRSADNGATFGPTGGSLIVSGSQGAFVTVGPDHAVYAFWYAGTTLQMRKSTDQALTFGPPVTVVSGLVGGTNGDLGLTGIRQGTASPAAFRSNEFPHVAVNPVSGHLYATFANNPPGTDKADVFMVMSADGGATWSAAVRVNDDATLTDQWQPTIAVTPEGGNIGIFYYSRQEDPANNNLFKFYGRTGIISGSTVTFTPSFAISDVASLPEFGRDAIVNSVYMGDYDVAVATPGKFHVVWADNREDLAGGAPRKDPNIYYESIPAGLLTGANISVAPASVNFGSVAVTATGGPTLIAIANIGDAPLTIGSITSPAPDFALGVPALPAVVPPGGSISLSATFAPATLGAQASSFTITSNALNTPVVTVSLAGTGVSNINVSPVAVNFGSVAVGQTSPAAPITVQNRGTVPLTITAISAPPGDFSRTSAALPIVLPALGTTTVNTFFAPTSPGPHSSSFNIVSDAIGSPTVTVNLQGNGIVPPSNDLCGNAIAIACGSSVDGTTVLATLDNVGTCGTSNTAPGVWYTVVGTGAQITVSTCAAASYDTKLSVFSGTCGALVCVGGNDDFSGCGLRSQVTFNSVAGTTYYILVHGFLTQTGTFTLSTSQCPAEIAVSPAALSLNVPVNGTGSKGFNIANTADAGALDLVWSARSVEGTSPLRVGQSMMVTQPVALFQITDQTIAALGRLVPTAIRRSLEGLMAEPPSDKETFAVMLTNALGQANAESFRQVIMENAILFYDGVKGQLEFSGTAAGGPDGFGYEFIDSDEPGGPAFNWIDITGTGTPVVLGDDADILVSLPFAFPFYGVNKTQVRISSNGYLTFGTSGTTFTNTNIPNAAAPNDIICPFWDDLHPGASPGGTIHYRSSATQFIVQYTTIRRFGTTIPVTFQVILNADGSMLFQYLDMQGVLTSATVGVENAGGTVGLQVVFNAPYIHNNLAVRVALPPPCPWVSSIAPSSGVVPAGGSQPVVVGVNAAGLPIGTYECHLSISSNAVNASRLNLPMTLIVGTPVERIDDLIAKIQALKTAGVLNDGQANSLIVKLNAAKASLQKGKPNTAVNQLNAFINEVNALRAAGTLTPAQAQMLIDSATQIIALINGGAGALARGGSDEGQTTSAPLPTEFALDQNYPNPFNPSTVIRYALPVDADVVLEVYDVLGRLVAELVNDRVTAGYHEVQFDGSRLASGMYMYRIKAQGAAGKPFAEVRKFLLVK